MLGDATAREGLLPSTRWTIVLEAGQSQSTSGRALSVLSELCRIYWRPPYLFLRREGIVKCIQVKHPAIPLQAVTVSRGG
jgi:hypothetical protein